jgi:hypothetical protein
MIIGFDWVIVMTIALFQIGVLAGMRRAHRPLRWIAGWGAWFAHFWINEILGALDGGNTLSENLVQSVPMEWLAAGTVLLGVDLLIHWPDLNKRLHARRRITRVRVQALGPDLQPDPAHPYLSIRRYAPALTEIAAGYTVARIVDLWVNSNASGNCFGLVFDPSNNSDLNAILLQHWPDNLAGLEIPVHRNVVGQAEASFVMSGFNPANGPGPYTVDLKGRSDALVGAGLPNNWHEEIWIVWREEVVPPKNVQGATLEETAIQAACAAKPWMPINTDGALYKFALSTKGPRLPSGQFSPNLGYPQTDEFEFSHDGVTYVGQVYNLAIVYVKKGDWANVRWVGKAEGM